MWNQTNKKVKIQIKKIKILTYINNNNIII